MNFDIFFCDSKKLDPILITVEIFLYSAANMKKKIQPQKFGGVFERKRNRFYENLFWSLRVALTATARRRPLTTWLRRMLADPLSNLR